MKLFGLLNRDPVDASLAHLSPECHALWGEVLKVREEIRDTLAKRDAALERLGHAQRRNIGILEAEHHIQEIEGQLPQLTKREAEAVACFGARRRAEEAEIERPMTEEFWCEMDAADDDYTRRVRAAFLKIAEKKRVFAGGFDFLPDPNWPEKATTRDFLYWRAERLPPGS